MNFDQDQRAAIDAATNGTDRLHVITGPAGTGKTTIIKAIADQLGGRVTITAPTGKAAARLKEATGYQAVTIHRKLMWDGSLIRRSAAFGLPVIVDEASMVDSWLMAQLVKFKPPKLVLVGDADQLPPVGKGQPFHDLIRLRPDHVSHLHTCYRSKEAVHMACMDVRAGKMPPVALKTEAESWRMIETGQAENSTAKLIEWIRAGLYDPARDAILACRYGAGNQDEPDGGIDSLNAAVKALVNPGRADKFTEGDRVICCKNFGTLDLWNGDMGTVESITHKGGVVIRLDRGGDTREVERKNISEIKLAYAMSVHKAQGSQFRRVFFLSLHRQRMMLSRSLIYTAITRAREGVCVFGELRSFENGISSKFEKITVLQALGKAATA